jgi:hypothetical protein
VHSEFRTYYSLFRILSHASPAEIVAAPDSGEPVAAPRLCCAHFSQDFFGFPFHPIGEPVLVLAKVIGNPEHGQAQAAPVSTVRVKLNVVVHV